MKTTKFFQELLMTANGGHERAADDAFIATMRQFSREFNESENELMGYASHSKAIEKGRLFIKCRDMDGVSDEPSDLRLIEVGIGGSWFILPDRPAIYLYSDLDPVRSSFYYLGENDGEVIYEVIHTISDVFVA